MLCYQAKYHTKIGVIQQDNNDSDEAIEQFKKTLKIYEPILNEDDVEIATLYNNIGGVYSGKNDLNSALEYFIKSLEIR